MPRYFIDKTKTKNATAIKFFRIPALGFATLDEMEQDYFSWTDGVTLTSDGIVVEEVQFENALARALEKISIRELLPLLIYERDVTGLKEIIPYTDLSLFRELRDFYTKNSGPSYSDSILKISAIATISEIIEDDTKAKNLLRVYPGLIDCDVSIISSALRDLAETTPRVTKPKNRV